MGVNRTYLACVVIHTLDLHFDISQILECCILNKSNFVSSIIR